MNSMKTLGNVRVDSRPIFFPDDIFVSVLNYSKEVGNDLSTPIQLARFPGLIQGDRWCLCAGRWLEAYKEGKAPKIFLENTHIDAMKIIPRELLEEFAAQIN